MVLLGSQGVLNRCHVLHIPGLGLLGLQLMLITGLPSFLYLLGRMILPRVGRKSMPLLTSLRSCPGSVR